MTIYSSSPEETEKLAKKIAGLLKGSEIIALYGDLGAGKTTFTKGLADFFGLKREVSSPTFSLVNEYKNIGIRLYHFDMYRVSTYEDLESTGFFDYIGEGILIIEWSENIEKSLPKDVIKISFEKKDEKSRIIDIKGIDLK